MWWINWLKFQLKNSRNNIQLFSLVKSILVIYFAIHVYFLQSRKCANTESGLRRLRVQTQDMAVTEASICKNFRALYITFLNFGQLLFIWEFSNIFRHFIHSTVVLSSQFYRSAGFANSDGPTETFAPNQISV